MSLEGIHDPNDTSDENDDLSAATDETSLPPQPREPELTLSDSIDFIGQDMMASASIDDQKAESRRTNSSVPSVKASSSSRAELNSNDHTIISTPDLCDTYSDTIHVLDPIFSSYGGRKRFAGTVYTVKCFEDCTKLRELAVTKGHGRILVVDGGGSRRRAVLDDMIALDFSDHGWAGLVIFGSVRDVDELNMLPLGVQALGAHPFQAETRGEGQVNVPISIAGVTIRPGDSMCCDRNGIVINSMPMIMNTGADLTSIPSQDHHRHSKRRLARNSRQSENSNNLLSSIPSGEMT